jgi:hypothetical protein
MDAPPLDNRTDFAVHPQLLLDHDGEKLCAMVKATFELPPDGGPLELAPPERTRPIRFADIPWGKPEISSIAYPADVCLRKPGTDVLFVAKGYAPRHQPVPSFDVRVEVGPLSKSLRVFGLRVWEMGGAGLSRPAPIDEIELRYDYAWGGTDDSDPARIVEEARNPVGMGVTRSASALTDQRAPSIEDPASFIKDHRTRPPPAGIGAIGRHWEPRRRYAGTYDAAWKEFRAPLPPEDLDDRFHHAASPGLVSEVPLTGPQKVALLNLVPGGGAIAFEVPDVAVEIEFRAKGRETAVVRPHLDTLLFDLYEAGPEKPIAVEMVWRASITAPRRMKDSLIVVRERELS